jgi:hypothetical protein
VRGGVSILRGAIPLLVEKGTVGFADTRYLNRHFPFLGDLASPDALRANDLSFCVE